MGCQHSSPKVAFHQILRLRHKDHLFARWFIVVRSNLCTYMEHPTSSFLV